MPLYIICYLRSDLIYEPVFAGQIFQIANYHCCPPQHTPITCFTISPLQILAKETMLVVLFVPVVVAINLPVVYVVIIFLNSPRGQWGNIGVQFG